jgi:hypothetical protein
MRPSSLNQGLMADFKRNVDMALGADQDPAQGITFFESRGHEAHEAMHKGLSESYQNIEAHKELAELMPEPAGGYRANLITFGIRARVLGLDKHPDFRKFLAVERAYHGINQLAFLNGRQTGKSGQTAGSAREFLSNWLNYIEQAVSTKGV